MTLTTLLPGLPFRNARPEPEVSYASLPASPEHAQRISLLGISSPLLRPLLPARSTTTTSPRSLYELPSFYRPARFRLTNSSPSLLAEKPDTWFEMLFVDVYAQARRFSEGFFGGGDIPPTGSSLWGFGRDKEKGKVVFGKAFLEYASLVSRQDSNLGGWEGVLRSDVERTAMVCGVVGKALEDGAWDRLLFGAGEGMERVLGSLDEGMVGCDGEFFPPRDEKR